MPEIKVGGKVKHLPYTKKNIAMAARMKHKGKGMTARVDNAAQKVGF